MMCMFAFILILKRRLGNTFGKYGTLCLSFLESDALCLSPYICSYSCMNKDKKGSGLRLF